MIPIYIVSAIVGGGLVLVSAFMGHGDGGLGHDAPDHGGFDHGDLDHDHDAHADAHLWIPFLSLRFWTYFFAAFGIVGLMLTRFVAVGEPATGIIAGGTGLVAGLLISALMRVARRMETDSSAKTQDFLGATGIVVVAIRPSSEGKIRVNIKGEIIELLAQPSEGETLEIGSEAVIITMENDRARVMSRASLLEETLEHHA